MKGCFFPWIKKRTRAKGAAVKTEGGERNWLVGLVWGALGLGVLAVWARAASGAIPKFLLFNSDALYLPALVQDWAAGMDLSGWRFPPAPSLFPDAVVVGLLIQSLGDLRLATLLYGGLQALALAVAWRAAARAGDGAPNWFPLAVGLALVLLASGRYLLWSPMLVSGHHFSLLVGMGAGLALVLGLVRARPRRAGWALAGLGLLVGVLTASDPLFALVFAAPAAGSLVLTAAVGRLGWRRWLPAAGATAAAAAVGVGAQTLLWGAGAAELTPYWGWDAQGLARLGSWALRTGSQQILLAALWLVGMWAVVWRLPGLAQELHRGARLERHPEALVVELVTRLFLLGVVVGCALIPVLSGSVVERQILAGVMLPVFFVWGFVGWPVHIPLSAGTCARQRSPEQRLRSAMTLLAGVTCLAGLSYLGGWGQMGTFLRWQPAESACLDAALAARAAEGGTPGWGLADYWQARPLRLFSQGGARLAPVQSDLSAQAWIHNFNDYRQRFTYAVVDTDPNWPARLDEGLLRARFGPPQAVFTCAGEDGGAESRVLFYDRPENADFQEQFWGHPAFARWEAAGDSFAFSAAQLGSETGDRLGVGRQVREGHGPAGALVILDVSVPAGLYELEADYASGDPQARWEAETAAGSQGDGLALGEGQTPAVRVPVGAGEHLRWRLVYSGQGWLRVGAVTVRRLR